MPNVLNIKLTPISNEIAYQIKAGDIISRTTNEEKLPLLFFQVIESKLEYIKCIAETGIGEVSLQRLDLPGKYYFASISQM